MGQLTQGKVLQAMENTTKCIYKKKETEAPTNVCQSTKEQEKKSCKGKKRNKEEKQNRSLPCILPSQHSHCTGDMDRQVVH